MLSGCSIYAGCGGGVGGGARFEGEAQPEGNGRGGKHGCIKNGKMREW